MIQSGLICALVWILMQGTDRLLGWQTLQRPIVTATVTGFLLGDIRTGMIMAASLEAIFMGISAIGGSIPSDACASSIIAVAYTILTGADVETGLALAMPIGTLMGQQMKCGSRFLQHLLHIGRKWLEAAKKNLIVHRLCCVDILWIVCLRRLSCLQQLLLA